MWKTFIFQAIQFSQTVLIQTIQFSINMQIVLFNPLIGPYQVLPFRARVDLGAMAKKGCSAFPKAPTSDHLVSYPGHSLGRCLTPPQRSSRCCLQPLPRLSKTSCLSFRFTLFSLSRQPEPQNSQDGKFTFFLLFFFFVN